NDIAAMIWNGTSWTNPITLEITAAGSTVECADAAYEAGTGRCMIVWGRTGSNVPRSMVWSGSAWGATMFLPDAGAVPNWVHLAADPASNKLMLGMLDASGRISTSVWDGSAW